MTVDLKPLPGSFQTTRVALHRMAEEIVAPARKPDNEIALTATPGGFGTPEFEFEGRRIQVRVEGAELVVARDGDEERARIVSLAGAGEALGPSLLPSGLPDDSSPLEIDPEAAALLGDYYGLAAAVLGRFRSELPSDAEPSGVNIWPEHFDIAFEAGSEAAGRRANYGASPGDEGHSTPYLYVGPWTAEVEGELWNGEGFNGAQLAYADLRAADDCEAAALEFFRSRFEALASAG